MITQIASHGRHFQPRNPKQKKQNNLKCINSPLQRARPTQATTSVCLTHKGSGHVGIDDLGYQNSQRGLQVLCFLTWPWTFVTSTLFLFCCSPVSAYIPVSFFFSCRPSAMCAAQCRPFPGLYKLKQSAHHHQSIWASANRIRTKSICATTP